MNGLSISCLNTEHFPTLPAVDVGFMMLPTYILTEDTFSRVPLMGKCPSVSEVWVSDCNLAHFVVGELLTQASLMVVGRK